MAEKRPKKKINVNKIIAIFGVNMEFEIKTKESSKMECLTPRNVQIECHSNQQSAS